MPNNNITITIPQQPFNWYKNIAVADNYVTRALKAVTNEPHVQIRHTDTMIIEIGDLLYKPTVLFSDDDIASTIPNSPMTIVFEQYTKFKNP